ncbi:response regulator [Paenibacillus sp. BK720]|uniref:response regulator n=1 Tax=Paenibacillus sp. BK720 TaxID=2587092 RepID=UPI0014237845|nr:response regulator [Paenibacillus sp. BK720]NIK68035.1 two-component system response regulator YesN [Paenibacillus sp. BK720]
MNVTVVLADDEPLILKGLSKLIPWEEQGIDIIGFAYDGKELLEMIEQRKPDIVISDISMPHLSGIDIIKEVKHRELPCKVIFVSAYQEFKYARDAIAYGAVDYLVKPVKKSDLEAVLAKALSLILEKGEEDRRRSKLDLLERKNHDDEVDGWVEQLAEGTLSEQSEGYRYLTEKLLGPLYTIGAARIDPVGNDNERWPMQTQKLVQFAIHNIVQESIAGIGQGYSYEKAGSFVFALSYEEPGLPVRLAETIKDNIFKYLKLNVSVGVGESVKQLSQLSQSREQAEHALSMTYFTGLHRVIRYRKPEQRKDREKELFILQSEIIRVMTEGSWDIVLLKVKELLQVIESAAIGNRQLAVSTCFSALLYIVQEVKKSDAPMSDWGFDIQHLQSRLGKYETFEEMCEGVYDMMQLLFNRIGDNPDHKEQTMIARVVQYIEQHYMEDISLESVAAVAFMNPYYFSSFFKKQMKRNFKQYVTDLRMEHALSLLKHTDMMVYEIAEKVGYNNARHFSDMFKKQTGRLPQEYKNALRDYGGGD